MRKGVVCYKQFLLFSQCFPQLYLLVASNFSFSHSVFHSYIFNAELCGNGLIGKMALIRDTAAVTKWLERPPHKWEVMGLIPSRAREKSFKLVHWLSFLALRIMGIVLQLARQCWDNGLVKYWLQIAQETWIYELSPLNN